MTTKEMLQSFKDEDSCLRVYPMLEDEQLRSLVYAWSLADVLWDEGIETKEVDSRTGQWRELWKNCKWNASDLALMTGMGIEVMNFVKKAIAFRLIYPDGTVSESAMSFIDVYAEKHSTPDKEEGFGSSLGIDA